MPGNLKTCVKAPVETLPEGDWSVEVTIETTSRLIESEHKKDRCGRDLLQFYEDVRGR